MTKRSALSHAANAGRRAAALLVVVTIAARAGSDTSADIVVDPDPAATTPAIDEATATPARRAGTRRHPTTGLFALGARASAGPAQ
jgi:hypothetical protein